MAKSNHNRSRTDGFRKIKKVSSDQSNKNNKHNNVVDMEEFAEAKQICRGTHQTSAYHWR